MTLSDKKVIYGNAPLLNGMVCYQKEDVKQFIKDLKDYEDLKIRLGNESKYLSEEEKEIHTTSCIDTKMEIDKLAGKELISDKEQKRKKE